MRVAFFGVGRVAKIILNQINMPSGIEHIGFVDNDSDKWGSFMGKPVYSPRKICEIGFDKLIILTDDYYETIKSNLIYWFHIEADKIKDSRYLLKLLLMEKYQDSEDIEIQKTLKYLETNNLSVFNQYVKETGHNYIVQWDFIENLPFITFEDKKMYFPYDYTFEEVDGQKIVKDILSEQQLTSPHLYIKESININLGDVIADAGVMEGNFALRYIEKVSKAYLFECDSRWIKPLKKTFEKFNEKVVFCNEFLGQYNGNKCTNLDTVIKGQLNFLKMDIEGAEIEALLGAKNVLSRNDVKCSICSYHKCGDEVAIRDLLNQYGYQTAVSDGYMLFYDDSIFSTLDFRRGIVYAKKSLD